MYCFVTMFKLLTQYFSLCAVRTAISQGADVTYQDDDGVTPLMTAAENGHAESSGGAAASWSRLESTGRAGPTAVHPIAIHLYLCISLPVCSTAAAQL